MVISFSKDQAFEQLEKENKVYTLRMERRAEDEEDTWVNRGRGNEKEFDAEVTLLGQVHHVDLLRHYAGDSGFWNVRNWLDALQEIHGEGTDFTGAYLYRVTRIFSEEKVKQDMKEVAERWEQVSETFEERKEELVEEYGVEELESAMEEGTGFKLDGNEFHAGNHREIDSMNREWIDADNWPEEAEEAQEFLNKYTELLDNTFSKIVDFMEGLGYYTGLEEMWHNLYDPLMKWSIYVPCWCSDYKEITINKENPDYDPEEDDYWERHEKVEWD